MKRVSAALLVLVLAACTATTSPSPSGPLGPTTSVPTTAPTTKPTATATEAPTAASAAPWPPEPTSDLGDFVCTLSLRRRRQRRSGPDRRRSRRQPLGLRPDRLPVREGHPGAGRQGRQAALHPRPERPADAGRRQGLPRLPPPGRHGLGPSGRVTYDGPTDFTPGYPIPRPVQSRPATSRPRASGSPASPAPPASASSR